MKKTLLLVLLVSFFNIPKVESQINQKLKTELDSIYRNDQILREYLSSRTTENRKMEILKETGFDKDPNFRKNVYSIMKKQDSLNLIKIEKIFKEYGYPGKSLVGEPTNKAAFFVIQHSDKIAEYLPLIKKAADEGELPFMRYAMMLDRSLTQQGKEQIYGSQIQGMKLVNKDTGKESFFYYVSPIQDPENVNKRREEAGFSDTVEEFAKGMSVEYKVYTLEDIKKMK